MSVSYFNNAKQVVDQMRRGEWKVVDMHEGGGIFRIARGDVQIWVANGGFFCEIYKPFGSSPKFFGFVYRHWVWFHAKKIVKKARAEFRMRKNLEIKRQLGIK